MPKFVELFHPDLDTFWNCPASAVTSKEADGWVRVDETVGSEDFDDAVFDFELPDTSDDDEGET